MARATSTLLLLVGAVLLVAWLVAPASSAPQRAPASHDTTLDQVLPALADVNAQVDRLRDRLNTSVTYPAPTRDPFNYRAPAPRRAAGAPVVASTPVADVAPVPVAPPLVAILTGDGDTTSAYSAVFAVHDDVRVAAVGDEVDGFRVTTIDADGVVLGDLQTGQTVRVALR